MSKKGLRYVSLVLGTGLLAAGTVALANRGGALPGFIRASTGEWARAIGNHQQLLRLG